MSRAYYNDCDPFAAQWLQRLIAAGQLSPGTVDSRDLRDVTVDDVAPTAHFFAGLGGWDYALRLAGWPADEPVWTGSCPCQPFSVAGLRRENADNRHLWPVWCQLVAKRQPPVLFGEQVAGKAGRNWLAVVRADLEELGYVVGAADLCAAGAGAPHNRARLFWGARLADADRCRSGGWADLAQRSAARGVAAGRHTADSAHNPWQPYLLIESADGYRRPIGPVRDIPLADGLPPRLGAVRSYGNAIVPQIAALFINAFMQAADDDVAEVTS